MPGVSLWLPASGWASQLDCYQLFGSVLSLDPYPTMGNIMLVQNEDLLSRIFRIRCVLDLRVFVRLLEYLPDEIPCKWEPHLKLILIS